MTQYPQDPNRPSVPEYGVVTNQPQHQAPKKTRRWLPWMIGAGLFVFGVAIGTSGSGDTTTAPSPQPTVTKTVPGPTVVKTVPTVPAICKTALADADKVISIAGEGFGLVSEAMGAASEFDASGIEAATRKLNTLSEEKLTPQLAAYKAARDACNS